MAGVDVITISSSPPREALQSRRASLRPPSSPHTSPFFTRPDQYTKRNNQLKSGSSAGKVPEGVNTGCQTAKDLSILDGLSRFAFKSQHETSESHELVTEFTSNNDRKTFDNSTEGTYAELDRRRTVQHKNKRGVDFSPNSGRSLYELRENYRIHKSPSLQSGDDIDVSIFSGNTKDHGQAFEISGFSTKNPDTEHHIRNRQRPKFIACSSPGSSLIDGGRNLAESADTCQQVVPPLQNLPFNEPTRYETKSIPVDAAEHAVEVPPFPIPGELWSKVRQFPCENLAREASQVRVPSRKAKSSRTVTGIALAAFQGQCLSETSLVRSADIDLRVKQSNKSSKVNKANEAGAAATEPLEDKAEDASAKKKRKRPVVNARKKDKKKVSLPRLPVPADALQTLKAQKWLFGTSSQLTQETSLQDVTEPPTDIQAPTREAAETMNNQKLWDVATFAEDNLEYVESVPVLKAREGESPFHAKVGQQAVPHVSSPTATVVSAPVKLSAPPYSRPKPTLLCASRLTQNTDTKRMPLVPLPINARGIHVSAADFPRSTLQLPRGPSQATAAPVVPMGEDMSKGKKKRAKPLSDTEDSPDVGLTKKSRGRPRAKSAGVDAPKAVVKKPRGRPPTAKSKQQKSPSRKVKKDEEGFEEIDDSEADVTPSPPRQQLNATIGELETEQPKEPTKTRSKRPQTDSAASEADRIAELRLQLFPKLTHAIKTTAPTLDPRTPSWHEKILLYDPIVLEDVTAWFNDGRLGDLEQPVLPSDVRRWCEENSICCIWRNGAWGGVKDRY